mmetsp:Transcript_15532/g.25589  ORF Transcript_15532/g.25589 Transcript_15532/m.25589 type:complete len:200 (-) Transcript_15532:823-1422(-)
MVGLSFKQARWRAVSFPLPPGELTSAPISTNALTHLSWSASFFELLLTCCEGSITQCRTFHLSSDLDVPHFASTFSSSLSCKLGSAPFCTASIALVQCPLITASRSSLSNLRTLFASPCWPGIWSARILLPSEPLKIASILKPVMSNCSCFLASRDRSNSFNSGILLLKAFHKSFPCFCISKSRLTIVVDWIDDSMIDQ